MDSNNEIKYTDIRADTLLQAKVKPSYSNCEDACGGYGSDGRDELRGGRCFELDENALEKIHTYMVHFQDLLF